MKETILFILLLCWISIGTANQLISDAPEGAQVYLLVRQMVMSLAHLSPLSLDSRVWGWHPLAHNVNIQDIITY